MVNPNPGCVPDMEPSIFVSAYVKVQVLQVQVQVFHAKVKYKYIYLRELLFGNVLLQILCDCVLLNNAV